MRCQHPLVAATLTTALLLVVLPQAVTGQDARVRTSVDSTLVTVGDQIVLTIQVDHAPGQTVVWPDSVDLSPFEVVEARPVPQAGAPHRGMTGLQLVLTTFELGSVEVPRLNFEVVSSDGSREAVSSDAWAIQVQSVGLDDGTAIRGIRGPLGILRDWGLVVPWVLLILIAIAGAVWWWSRSQRPVGVKAGPAPPTRPAHEVAFEALDQLAGSDLLTRGQVKAYHVAVSEIVRTYIENLFSVQALEMTTHEVAVGLLGVLEDPAAIARCESFLDACDLVKFAKSRPSSGRSHEMLAEARAFVQDTLAWRPPAPPPPPEPEPALDVESEVPEAGIENGDESRSEAAQDPGSRPREGSTESDAAVEVEQ